MASHPSLLKLRSGNPGSDASRSDNFCPRRVASLSAAVELQVDPDDLNFESEAERVLWEDLREEFEAFVSKIGPVWIAD